MATGDIKAVQEQGDSSYQEITLKESNVDIANVPTADEKAALAGTGTPSASNKYVTNNDSRLSDARTPTAHNHTLSEIFDAGDAASKNVGTGSEEVAAGNHNHSGVYDLTQSAIHGATVKTTPVDADTIGLIDSAASNVLKKLSWANIKATLKTYFDSLYEAAIGTKGTAFNKNFGTSEGDVCQGNDARLSDARTPTSHDNTAHSTNYEPELNADQKRKITYGTADPTGGSDGDIYLQYEA